MLTKVWIQGNYGGMIMLNFAGMNIAQVNRYMKGFSKIIKCGGKPSSYV
ncbi:hypothetical protein PITCH_A1100001 [uncultured Desulfobacterium sp.]|uniref:Uncharacterized protein n=1 Tax=uncultured Desulfobacterium sp. TaxID=201089 RepID=A0A445MR65_9BACT|nr:hypothetical protein PITCH_A1100001 [uncultured Desulfobacterium sp.]